MTDAPTDAEVVARRNDLEMLKRQRLWPGRTRGIPTVELKNTETGEFGKAMTEKRGFTVFVYKDGSYEIAEMRSFPDAEAIIDAGWLVD